MWLLVTGTSPAFCEDHPGGDKPHSHGMGLFSRAAFPPSHARGGITPETRHFHMVIFGFEVHVPATSPWALGERSSLPSQAGIFQLSAEIGNALQAPAHNVPASHTAIDVLDLDLTASAPHEVLISLDRFRALAAGSSLCEAARGLRSGTLQV